MRAELFPALTTGLQEATGARGGRNHKGTHRIRTDSGVLVLYIAVVPAIKGKSPLTPV